MFIRSSLRRPGVRFSPTRAKTLAHSAIPSGITTPSARRKAIAKCSKFWNFRGSTERPPGFLPSCGLLRGPHSLRREPEESNRLAGQSPHGHPERDQALRGTKKCALMAADIPFRSMPLRGRMGAFRNFDRAEGTQITGDARRSSFGSFLPSRTPLRGKRESKADRGAGAIHARSAIPGSIEPHPEACGTRRRRTNTGEPATRSRRDAPRDGTGIRRDQASRPSRHRNRDAAIQAPEELELASLPPRRRTSEARSEPMSRGSATAWGRLLARRGIDRMMETSRSEPLSATFDGQSMLLRFGRGSAAR